MNEQIRALAKQAENYAESKLKEGYAYDEIHFFYEKKFAELIVRECVQVGGQAFLRDNSTVPTFPTNQIFEHFGVEE